MMIGRKGMSGGDIVERAAPARKGQRRLGSKRR